MCNNHTGKRMPKIIWGRLFRLLERRKFDSFLNIFESGILSRSCVTLHSLCFFRFSVCFPLKKLLRWVIQLWGIFRWIDYMLLQFNFAPFILYHVSVTLWHGHIPHIHLTLYFGPKHGYYNKIAVTDLYSQVYWWWVQGTTQTWSDLIMGLSQSYFRSSRWVLCWPESHDFKSKSGP